IATPLTTMHFGYDPKLKPYPYDPAKAKQLLAEAGYPSGIGIVLHAPNGRYPRDREVAEAVAGQLTQAGIRTEVKLYEWTTYMSTITYRHGGAPMWMMGWGNPTWDAVHTLDYFFHTGQIQANYGNPECDKLLDEARSTMDQHKRQEDYSKVGKILLDDAAVLTLYQQIDNYGVNRRLEWAARSDERILGFEMALKP
ncbi:MAG TPA: ABC transporter substrate-binding protein, partial [Candidatus Sulfotelmatobacter sp.]|nr:ABC transporter substrate-binding protein [Candidatus Sulfotelmatobacter sp.]